VQSSHIFASPLASEDAGDDKVRFGDTLLVGEHPDENFCDSCISLLASTATAATYKIRAAGLNCNFCAYTIERLLGKVEGVDKKSIDVDVKTGLVLVSSRDDAFASLRDLKEAIEKGGYSYRGMEVSSSGRFVSVGGKLAFQPTGAQDPISLAEPPKDAKNGMAVVIHASAELSDKGVPTFKVEHFMPADR
jgi:copper chaperone CopZ